MDLAGGYSWENNNIPALPFPRKNNKLFSPYLGASFSTSTNDPLSTMTTVPNFLTYQISKIFNRRESSQKVKTCDFKNALKVSLVV